MIWIAISVLFSTMLICFTIVLLHLSDRAYSNAIGCLEDLCDTLNEKFPGSNLTIISSKGEVKVKGEIKYLIKHDN
jgi:hypothetical protein